MVPQSQMQQYHCSPETHTSQKKEPEVSLRFLDTSYTGWTGWICPILENYCGNFYLMSVLFFFMHLLRSPVTFYDISSDF